MSCMIIDKDDLQIDNEEVPLKKRDEKLEGK